MFYPCSLPMAVNACRRGLSSRHVFLFSSFVIAAFLFLLITPAWAQGVTAQNFERNAAGVGVLPFEESSYNEVANITRRMRELEVQSSSETMATDERKYADDQLEQLGRELGRLTERELPVRGELIEADRYEEDSAPSAEVLLDANVTAEDLGATHARILPDSPWHVFKRIGRGLQEAFTFDPVKDAALKHQHAIQELAEVKQLVEERGAAAVAPEVIADSMERFQDKLAQATDSAAELKSVKIEDAAAVTAFVADFTDKQIKEQTVLDNLAQDVLEVRKEIAQSTAGEASRAETQPLEEVLAMVAETKDQAAVHLATVLVEVEETPEAIGARLTEALADEIGSAFLGLKHLTVLDEIAKAAPETVQAAVAIAKQATIEHFEERIKAVPPAVRAEKLEQYVKHTAGDEKRLFNLLEEIKQTADIPSDVLDKIEAVKEIAVKRFENKLTLIQDQGVRSQFLSDFTATGKVNDLVVLEEFRNRMQADTDVAKQVAVEHDKAIDGFKAKFTDTQSQDQAELFRKLSQEMTQNPSPKVFKLVRELEVEVRSDPQKSAFLDGLETEIRGEIQAKFRREGERYVERYASLDPNDMAVFTAVDFDPAFKEQVLQKKTEKLKDFAKDIERPEDFDRFYERFYKAPDVVIANIKEHAPDFQQAMQFKLRKIEEQRMTEERDRQVGRARVNYKEREINHQFDRLTRKEEEDFFRKLQEVPPEGFEARKQLWESKINSNYERLDERFTEQKRLFEERLKVDPFGCDEVCLVVQLSSIEQDQRHQRERLADQLQTERNRIEADRARQVRDNPLAGKCDSPASCLAYCRANLGAPGCEWLVDEPVITRCPAPSYWDIATKSCVSPREPRLECPRGQYWDGKACVADPFYRPPEDFRSCPWGMYWSDERATCVPDKRVNNCESIVTAGTVSYSENCNVPPVQLCPRDRRWDPVKRDCVPLDYLACERGYYFDYATRRCEKEVSQACPAGQSWDEGTKICIAIVPERCPAFDVMPCPDGHYREFKQNPNGCWLPGGCIPVKQVCPKEQFPCPIGLFRAEKVRADGCVEYGQCEPPICPAVMPRICAPGEAPIPPDLRRNPCAQSSCIPGEENRCPQYSYFLQSCPTGYKREFTTDAKGCQVPGACMPGKPIGPCPAMPVIECPVGMYREFSTNAEGCSIPGLCISDIEPAGPCVTRKTEAECVRSGRYCEWKEGVCRQNEGVLDRCGDGICSGAETPAICAVDCRPPEACNRNGVCDMGETLGACPVDCAPKETPVCGNARCESGETVASCSRDCQAPPGACTTPATCFSETSCRGAGFVWCQTTHLCYREAAACPAPTRCGDARCEAGETVALCPADCAPAAVCGNARCESSETVATCPKDCESNVPPGVACATAITEPTCKLKPECEWRGSVCVYGAPVGYCGDNICAGTESEASCPADCKPAAICGDKICGATETALNCSSDCLDSQCAGSAYFCKTQDSCISRGSYWCGTRCEINPCAGGGVTCGNGRCEAVESGKTCPSDCSGANIQCSTSPASCTTPMDCTVNRFYWCNGACLGAPCTGGTTCNNNGTCDAGETVANCASDCGSTACSSGWTYKIDSRSCVRTGVVCSTPKVCDSCRTGAAQYCEWNIDGCPIACRSSAFCGNGVCDAGETYGSCVDCRGAIGTGTCSTQASLCTTIAQCTGAGYFWCANTNLCYATQASSPCFTTPGVCGDRICSGTETTSNCPADCGSASTETCGNGFCGSSETAVSCPADCGVATGCGSRVTQATCTTAPGCTWYVPPAAGTAAGAGSCVIAGSTGSTTGTCSTQASTCLTQATCTAAAYFWCASTNSCYATQATNPCSTSVGVCGDHICQSNETVALCPADCSTAAGCASNLTQSGCTGAGCTWYAALGYCILPGSNTGTCATQASLCTTQSACTSAAYFWCPSTNLCYTSQASNPCSAVCGDHICSSTETPSSCSADCGSASTETCGNGFCGSGETATSCAADCSSGTCSGSPSVCTSQSACTSAGHYWCANNSICYSSQSSSSCASTDTCGNGFCASSETATSCPADCGSASCAGSPTTCMSQSACTGVGYYWCSNNSMCYPSQGSSPCATASAVCGNSACDSGETAVTCPADCGGGSTTACNSNGVCDGSESAASCPADCGSGGSTTCSAAMPGMCHSSAECSSIGYFWCASSSMCYSTQASSPCSTTGFAPGSGGTRWSQADPLYRLAKGVGDFARSLVGLVAKAINGF